MRNTISIIAGLGALFGVCALTAAADLKPIAIAEVKHDGPVDFQKEILPILQKKCLACHNATDAESDLVLENPQTMLKGGSDGPAVVMGKGAESLVIKLAARLQDPAMPPDGNKVGAMPLSPEELGLLKLWIDQGAMGSVNAGLEPIKWQALPPGVIPIYAVALSPDGQWAAASRANQIFLYHVPTKREYGRLTDPALIASGMYKNPGVAHLDLVQSLRFSPDSQLLVSGEYRTMKFWQRAGDARKLELKGFESPIKALAVSADGKLAAFGEENGKTRLIDLTTGNVVRALEGQHGGPVTGVHFSVDGMKVATGSQDKKFAVWTVADGKQIGIVETPAPVNAVSFVAQDQQIATGGADNIIRTWALPMPVVAGAEPPKPLKELKGHSGPITSLALSTNAAHVLSSSQDGTARVWDVNGGNQVQQLNHGAPVQRLAVRTDGQRFATAGANNIAKLWNGGNAQQMAEVKGDFRSRLKVEESHRTAAIAKRHVDGANEDLKQANERKTAEEKNVTASEEAHKKATEEFTKKTEAAKKPVEDKAAADKAFEESKVAAAKSEEAKKVADAAIPVADTAFNKAKTEFETAAKTLAEAEALAKTATDAVNKAKAEFEVAVKGLTDAEAVAKTAVDAVNKAKTEFEAAAKILTDVEAVVKTATDAINKAKVEFDTAAKVQTDAETAAKAAIDALAKAKEELNKKPDDENLKKGVADAEKALQDAEAKKKIATDDKAAKEKVKIDAEKTLLDSETKKKTATDEKAAKEKVIVDAETAMKAADEKKVAATNDKAAKEKVHLDAAAAMKGADEKRKVATDDKGAKEKVRNDAEAAKKVAEENKKKADAELTTAQNTMKQAEQKATQAKDPAQKALDEQTAAEKAAQSAMRSVERAKVSVKKATEAIPSFDAAVKQNEEQHKQSQAAVEQANLAVIATEKPFVATTFARDGLTFATSGDDQLIHTWDAETGAAIEVYSGHGAPVTLLAYTATNDILSVAANNTVFVWDTNPEWKLVRTVGSPDNADLFVDRITALDFSPDGKLLATGGGEPSRSGQLKIFHVADGSLAKEVKDAHSDVIYGLEFSPDGKQLASCGADRFAKVFDVESAKLVKGFEGHTHHVLGVTWRADGRVLATCGADTAIKVWDVRTGDQQRTIQGFNKEVTAIRFVAETDNVIASCGDNSVQMKNAANGGGVRGFSGPTDFVHACAVTGNGKFIIAGGQDSIVRIWQENGQEFAKFEVAK